jgi:hypothetical protein
MPINPATIAQMEKELEDAREQLLREDGRRYQILMREISADEKQRILDSLTDRHERLLFGLEPPGAGRGGEQSAHRAGDLVCSLCGKAGLTERGLKLHTARIHKGEKSAGQEHLHRGLGPAAEWMGRREEKP